VLSPDGFKRSFKEVIDTNKYNEVLIFGYTGEVMSDYLTFEVRSRRHVKFRILNRNWVREAEDEGQYNRDMEQFDRRRWEKAKGIKSRALEPWSRNSLRYYSDQPFVKAALLLGPPSMIAGFLSFYRWEETPQEGGSSFKGAGLSTLFIPGETKDEQKILEYLRSQFERIWKNALTADEVEKRASPSGR